MSARIGLVGVRGYVGAELTAILARRTDMALVFAASRQHAGEPLTALDPSAPAGLVISEPTPEAAARARLDALVLALPNGHAAPFVEAADPSLAIVDVSGDHRASPGWVYGLVEANRSGLRGARRIANPGCYATAAQLALLPLRDELEGAASVFGVSGFSGAGSTPGPRNDPARLADNLLAYGLAGHAHEAEIARGIGAPVRFTPHVAAFFRGLVTTVHAPLRPEALNEPGALRARFEAYFRDAPLIALQDEPPTPADGRASDGAVIGGFARGPDHAVIVCALDNLLKGAASQAVQNLALALGLPEIDGLIPPVTRLSAPPSPQSGRP